MKVVHLCHYTSGGASPATSHLHLGLRRLGVESTIFSPLGSDKIPYFEKYPTLETHSSALDEVDSYLIWNNRTPISNTHFSADYFGYNICDHPLIQAADILHLHWVWRFLSSLSIAELAALGKPIFWTLHDMRPLTGGCHFSAGCNRFEDACGQCPQLSKDFFTAQNLRAMCSAVAAAKPVFIAPSQWMLQNIRRSQVSKNSASYYIPYGIDAHIFKPLAKENCRSELNLKKDVWYILFASNTLQELRKGASYAFAILEGIRQHPITAELVATAKIRILCCGENAQQFTPAGWKVEYLGYCPPHKMPLFYNSGDVLLFTSLEDNLPNVILEAMACGIPTVSHRVGGTSDLLNGTSPAGCLVEIGNTQEAVTAIIDLFQNNCLYKDLSFRAVEKIRQNFSLEKQASACLQLYKDRLAQGQTKVTSPLSFLREGSSEALLFAMAQSKADRDRLCTQVIDLKGRISRLRALLNKAQEGMRRRLLKLAFHYMKHFYFLRVFLKTRDAVQVSVSEQLSHQSLKSGLQKDQYGIN